MILDVAPLELVILGGVALLVIPPKDLPRAMRFAGQWIGRARGLARQFRSGFDDMIREAEFAEMEKKWKAENERIMREFPHAADPYPALPSSEPATAHEPGDPAAPVDVPETVPAPVLRDDTALSPATHAGALGAAAETAGETRTTVGVPDEAAGR